MREITISKIGKHRLLTINTEIGQIIVTYALESAAKRRADQESRERRLKMSPILYRGRWAIAEGEN